MGNIWYCTPTDVHVIHLIQPADEVNWRDFLINGTSNRFHHSDVDILSRQASLHLRLPILCHSQWSLWHVLRAFWGEGKVDLSVSRLSEGIDRNESFSFTWRRPHSFLKLLENGDSWKSTRLTCMLCRASCCTIVSTAESELGKRSTFRKTAVTLTQDSEVQNKQSCYLEAYYCRLGASTSEKVDTTVQLYHTFCTGFTLSVLYSGLCSLAFLHHRVRLITVVWWRISRHLNALRWILNLCKRDRVHKGNQKCICE